MSGRTKVVGATALLILGVFVVGFGYLGGDLNAAATNQVHYDISNILVWTGGITLVVSALLFISASNRA